LKHLHKFYISGYKKLYYDSNNLKILSRKEKKAILGQKLNKSVLRRRLTRTIVKWNTHDKRAYSNISDIFCPNCGCTETYNIHHYVEYPEIWEEHKCLRCDFIICYADNSPFIHYLEDCGYEYWKQLGVQYVDNPDKQDDEEFKLTFAG